MENNYLVACRTTSIVLYTNLNKSHLNVFGYLETMKYEIYPDLKKTNK